MSMDMDEEMECYFCNYDRLYDWNVIRKTFGRLTIDWEYNEDQHVYRTDIITKSGNIGE